MTVSLYKSISNAAEDSRMGQGIVKTWIRSLAQMYEAIPHCSPL